MNLTNQSTSVGIFCLLCNGYLQHRAYYEYMADALISYAIAFGVFVGLVVILFSTRTKRRVSKKETQVGTSEEIKHSPG